MSPAKHICIVVAAFGAGSLAAQELYVYPSQGQGQQQVEQDKTECQTWARQTTGFDPTTPPPAAEAPPSKPGSGTRGAAGGAAAGAIVGGVVGDAAGKGAAVGGLIGGIRGRHQAAAEQQTEAQQQQQQGEQYAAQRGDYTRAYSACLEGRGYTVK